MAIVALEFAPKHISLEFPDTPSPFTLIRQQVLDRGDHFVGERVAGHQKAIAVGPQGDGEVYLFNLVHQERVTTAATLAVDANHPLVLFMRTIGPETYEITGALEYRADPNVSTIALPIAAPAIGIEVR